MQPFAAGNELKNWKAPFFAIWSGQAISLLGSQLVQFALVWWLTQTTGSATVLATATLVALLPQVFLMPLAGALVDRWSRRVVMIVADLAIALATVGLAALFWSGQVQVWHVYLLMFVRAVGGGFHWPAMQASTSLMVPKEHLSRIQGLNQMLHGLMNIGSAPLAALLLVVLPMQGILSIDVLTALLAVVPLLLIAIPQPVRSPQPAATGGEAAGEAAAETAAQPTFWQDLKAGFRYVLGWPGLLIIGLMATLINLLLVPSSSLQPILVTDHFAGGALQLAWLESAWGVGVVAGGITLGVWGGFRRRVVTSLVGLVLLGASILGIGLLPAGAFWLAVGLTFAIGFTNPIVNGPLMASIQAAVSPEMQGRVFTLIASVAAAMSPLGLLVAGPVADRFGVQIWFLVGGVATILIALAGAAIPAVMHFEDGRGEAAQAAVPDEAPPVLAAVPVEVAGD